MLHANFLGIGIHQLGESFGTAGHVFGQRNRGVIARLHHHAFFHFHQRRGFVDLKAAVTAIGGSATFAPSVFAHHHRVGRLDLAGGHFRRDDIAGHHLGDTGRLHLCIDIVTGQYLAGGGIHQHPCFADFRGRGIRDRQCVTQCRLPGRRGGRFRRLRTDPT